MPILKKVKDAKVELPKEPFLAVQVSETEWVPLPRGAQFAIVEDPDDENKRFPLVLKEVRRNRLVFICADTEYTYRLTSGKPLNAKALKRMQESRGSK